MLALVACGGNDAGDDADTLKTAAEVVAALKSAGLPVSGTFVYTAQNDTSGLFGTGDGYQSRVNFQDSRVVQPGGAFTVANGGSVEMFKSAKLAAARHAELRSASASAAEYVYTNGGAVLRLSPRFSLEQAEAYAGALSSLKPR